MNGTPRRLCNISPLLLAVSAGLLLLCSHAVTAEPPPLAIGPFSAAAPGPDPPDSWKPLTFTNITAHTRYRLVRDGDITVIRADSHSAASGLAHRLSVDPHTYPILEWRWKIKNILPDGDVTRKSGDDYPARIYVTFAVDTEQLGFWERAKHRAATAMLGEAPPLAALNYIWANHAPVGTIASNPFTNRARMIVIQSGTAKAGQWQTERRNIVADYRAAFNADPPAIATICIMTDSDNTGGQAVAWYGDIRLLPPPHTPGVSDLKRNHRP